MGLTRWISTLRDRAATARRPSGAAKSQLDEIARISDGGERVTHLYPNDCYFAHLSIYRFALDYARGRSVLDAGSGSGYGSAYLARSGARDVTAVEYDHDAVLFSRAHFNLPNLVYHQGDIGRIGENFGESKFDVIFTSNVVEHIQDVAGFLHGSVRCLEQEGILVFAVPPIVNRERLADDLRNPHHINHWSPHQWHEALARHYEDVVPYRHSYVRTDLVLNFANTPEDTRVTENDFFFEAVPIEQLYQLHTFTVLFLARAPRKAFWRERAPERIDHGVPAFDE